MIIQKNNGKALKKGSSLQKYTRYQTDEYDMFCFLPNNRAIIDRDVDRIAESMKERGYIWAPITVCTKAENMFYILDGQHRFMACKNLGIPFDFEIEDDRQSYEIGEMNSLQNRWKLQDFIESNIHNRDGSTNYNYKRLSNLREEFRGIIPDALILKAIGINMSGTDNRKYRKSSKYQDMKKGYLYLPDEEYFRVKKLLEDIVSPIAALKECKLMNQQYGKVILLLAKNEIIDCDKLAKQISKYSINICKVATMKQAIEQLDIVYNYNSKNKKHFRDAIEC